MEITRKNEFMLSALLNGAMFFLLFRNIQLINSSSINRIADLLRRHRFTYHYSLTSSNRIFLQKKLT